MTNMTVNGVTTTNASGQEQYEAFNTRNGRKNVKRFQYDYRHTDGELFSTVKATLEACRQARDNWISKKEGKA